MEWVMGRQLMEVRVHSSGQRSLSSEKEEGEEEEVEEEGL